MLSTPTITLASFRYGRARTQGRECGTGGSLGRTAHILSRGLHDHERISGTCGC